MEEYDTESGLRLFLGSPNDTNQGAEEGVPPPNWTDTLNRIIGELESSRSSFSKVAFTSLTDNGDRVRALVLLRPDVKQSIKRFIADSQASSKATKTAFKSDLYRKLGNEAYSSKNFNDASFLYTLAILFAPKESPSLALAYGNRSALFYEIGQWTHAIVDIDLALKVGHTDVVKLLLRKADCLVALGRYKETISLLDSPELKHIDCTQLRKIAIEGDTLLGECPATSPSEPMSFNLITTLLASSNLYEPSPRLSSLSRKLELKYDPTGKKGRYLVSTVDIAPGDLLAVEMPASSVLLKPYELTYCHHCCRRLEKPGDDLSENAGTKKANAEKCKGQPIIIGNLVPCNKCTRVLYCSTACRTASWTAYHRYECSILSILYEIGIGHLALRLLFSIGLKAILSVVRQGGTYDRLDLKDPVDGDVKSQYSPVYRLVHHSTSFNGDDLMQYTLTAGMLVELAKVAGFAIPADDLPFTGGILLRHILQLVTNAHSISHFIGNPNTGSFADVRIATALYPSISLLNHNCVPNVVATFTQGRVNVLRASKPIAAGEEVMNCYGVHFARLPVGKRQEMLKSQYFFECHCARCQMEVAEGIDGRYFPVACEQCRSLLGRTSEPNSPAFKCYSCNVEVPRSRVIGRHAVIESLLKKAKGLEKADELDDIATKLGRHLHNPSSLELGRLFDQLARLAHLRGDNKEAINYLEKSVAVVEANFGPTSIELACELVKLADMYGTVADKSVKYSNEAVATTKRALDLLKCFALLDCRPLAGDDSCYFGVEYRRLLRRQIESAGERPMSQLERLLEMIN